jgi:hypothetical protein
MRIFNMLIVGAALAATAIVSASGLKPGDTISAFHPTHVAGPLAGSDKCFPCTYKSRPQVQAWINGDTRENVVAIARALDAEMSSHKDKEFKAMIVMLTDKAGMEATMKMAKSIAESEKLKHVAIAVLDRNHEAVKAYQIDLKAKNTLIAYREWRVTRTAANVMANVANTQIDGLVASALK